MGAGLLVLLFLLGYVVPKFSHVYEDIQGNLPLMSQLLLSSASSSAPTDLPSLWWGLAH